MKEKEFKLILDRESHKRRAKEIYSNQIDLLVDLANYGSNLIPRAYDSSNKHLEDIIIIGVLLKQVVSMVDAIEILVSNGAIQTAHLQARTLFEASLYIDWILKEESEKRARYYYVSNLRNQRLWALRFITGTREKESFLQVTSDLGKYLNLEDANLEKEARKQLSEIERVLGQSSFNEINKEFEAKRNRKTGVEVYWYKVLGITSIRKLAENVGHLAEYDIYYSRSSQVTHTIAYRDHIQFAKGKILFEPIRQLTELDFLLKFAIGATISTYQSLLNHYRPGELASFVGKYKRDWRHAFLSIPSVSYTSPPSKANIAS